MESAEDNSTFHLSPFENDTDVSLFYEQCKRRPLLNEVKMAIFGSVSVLTLIGDQGAGKTMLCKMVELELSPRYMVIFHVAPVQSYGDVLRPIALKLGVKIEAENEREEAKILLPAILEQLQQSRKKLLIIFDEAEKIFLATLERIRKMLDVLNENEHYLQILFSGESSLQNNLQQLSLCTFQGASERTFALHPLDAEETFGYLHFRLRQSEIEQEELFSRQDSSRIFALTNGNFGLINEEARKIIPDASQTTQISLARENLRRTVAEKRKEQKKIVIPVWAQQSKFLLGVAAVVLGVVLLLVINRSPDLDPVGRGMPARETLTGEKVHVQKRKIKRRTVKKRATRKIVAPVQQEQAEKRQEKQQETVGPAVVAKAPEIPREPDVKKSGDTDSQPESVQQEQEGGQVPQDVVEEGVFAGNTIETQPFVVINSESGRFVPEQTDAPVPVAGPLQAVGGDQLFRDRVGAAQKWLKSKDSTVYTVQLMLLTSKDAEKNLKKMFSQREYQEIADKFFILRTPGNASPLYLFYGEYPSRVSARMARNNLPVFLRGHSPYIISVKEAVQKSRIESAIHEGV